MVRCLENRSKLCIDFSFYSALSKDSPAYRKIPNISPGLIDILGTFWGAYIRGSLYGGAYYIRRAFCASICVF